MTLDEYRTHVQKLKDMIDDLQVELDKILTWEKVKAASGRARKKTVELSKAFKAFRKTSVNYCKKGM